MSSSGYRVAPLSTANIRSVALRLRELIGDPKKTMGGFLEKMLCEGMLHVVSDNDPRWTQAVEAVFSPDQHCIILRDRDYEACVDQTRPRSIFTFWHEFGHLVLGHQQTFSRDNRTKHKVYEDSEWQADQFAAEFLMPLPVIEANDIRSVSMMKAFFPVSEQAAMKRLRKLKRI